MLRLPVSRALGSSSSALRASARSQQLVRPFAANQQSTRQAHAVSNPTLSNIEKRWEGMAPQEQAELWMALRDRMTVDWNQLTMQEKKACEFHPRHPRVFPIIFACSVCAYSIKRKCYIGDIPQSHRCKSGTDIANSVLDRFWSSRPQNPSQPSGQVGNLEGRRSLPRRLCWNLQSHPLGCRPCTKDHDQGMARNDKRVPQGMGYWTALLVDRANT